MRSRCNRLTLRLRLFAIALGGLLAIPIAAAQESDNALEYAVKATYLYKFGPFVRWPDNAFAAPTSPFTICLLGRDPFGEQLDRLVQGAQFGTRAIAVRRLDAGAPRADCQVLYINAPPATVANAIKQVKGLPILTVTEVEHAAAPPGIINFVIQGNRVRFEVDNRAAAENTLVLSSKLLSLASSVTPKATEEPE
ncbi:MAG TPA: YfiR family protein [Spongiibacteraceae bacterium]|nr:YfiR family protein [Spongiibacteraceae bacterium]